MVCMGGEGGFKKRRLLGVSLVLLGVVLGVYALAFLHGYYYRGATLHLHVGTGYCAHIEVVLKRADGTEILIKNGTATGNAGVLTNIGKDWIENQLGNSPSTTAAQFIALSTDTSTPSASWTAIPNEITTGGLARAQGTYSDNGVGSWKITKTFTATSSFTGVQLTGLYYASTGSTLLAADTFTSVNLNPGDQLTVTWTVTVS